MTDISQKISKSLELLTDNNPSFRAFRYLLAVSGGLDSMVMVHAFHRIELNIGVAHFNFQLREDESEKDADLVREFCDRHGIPFYIRTRNTYEAASELNLSIQETARHLRYEFFEDIARERNYDYVCTAHHANDQLETFFIHLIRGSGLKGLTGIPARREKILRPMLHIPLSKLQEYSVEYNVNFRTDATNLSDDYLRNRIRHHITDPLIDWDPSYLSNALRSMSHLAEIQYYIEMDIADFDVRFVHHYATGIKGINLDHPELSTPKNLFLLREYLRTSGLYPDSIRNILIDKETLRTGNQYEGAGMDAFFDRGRLWLVDDGFFKDWSPKDRISVQSEGITELPGGDVIIAGASSEDWDPAWTVTYDPAQITLPLYVRHRQDGDRIWAGPPPHFRKTLKKLLTEKKIPQPFKDRIYILVDAKDKIVSVLGLMNSPHFAAVNEKNGQKIRYYSKFWKNMIEV